MKNLLFVLFIFLTGSVISQDLNCKKFEDGSYKIYDEKYGTTFISRTGNEQTESSDRSSLELLFSVVWVDECTYTLEIKEVLANPDNEPVMKELIVTVEIIEVKENSYVQRSTANFGDFELVSEVFRID